MKCGLVLLAVLVSIFTILKPSVDCGIKWYRSAHHTLPSSQRSFHLMINETWASICSPPPEDSARSSTGRFVINSSFALRGFTCPSWSRSRDAGVTISSELIMPGTSQRMWSLVLLCAVSQSQGISRPAIGLMLALGLPQTEAGAAAQSNFLTNALTSATTSRPPNTAPKALSNAPANTPSYATDNGAQYSSKAVPTSVAVTDTSASTAGSSNKAAGRTHVRVSRLGAAYSPELPSAKQLTNQTKPHSSESSSKLNKISGAQFVNNFIQRRSGSLIMLPCCAGSLRSLTVPPDYAPSLCSLDLLKHCAYSVCLPRTVHL